MRNAYSSDASRQSAAVFSSALLLGTALTIPILTTNILQYFFGAASGMGPVALGIVTLLGFFVAINWRWLLTGVRANPEMAFLIALAPLSVLWSIHPLTTIEGIVPLVVISALSLTLGAMLSLRHLLYFFAFCFTITGLASLFAIVALPETQGIPPWEGTWNGVHAHKNGLGQAAMIGAMLTASVAALTTGTLRLLALIALLLMIVLILGSVSLTAKLMCVIGLTGIATGVLWRRHALVWAAVFTTIILTLLFIAVEVLGTSIAQPLFDALGRKPTLSGRLPLWSIVWPIAMERPLLGYGYNAFWRPEAAHVQAMASNPKLFFVPFYSHNSIIEVTLGLGLLGLATLFLGLLRGFSALLRIMASTWDRLAAICCYAVLIGLLTLNITESFMLASKSMGWMMIVAITTSARLEALRRRVKPGRAKAVGAALAV